MTFSMRRAISIVGLITAVAPFSTCKPTGMSRSMRAMIPVNANVVRLRSNLAPDALYADARRLLAAQGLQVSLAPGGGRALSTDARRIGRSRREMRLTIEVTPSDGGSTLEATGSYAQSEGNWMGVALRGDDRRASEGFEEMVLLVGQLPHREIQYASK